MGDVFIKRVDAPFVVDDEPAGPFDCAAAINAAVAAQQAAEAAQAAAEAVTGIPTGSVTIYFGEGGDDLNDGLSATSPKATFAGAIDAAKQQYVGNVTLSLTSASLLVSAAVIFSASDNWIEALTIELNGGTLFGSNDGTRTHELMRVGNGPVVVSLQNGAVHSFSTVLTAGRAGSQIKAIDLDAVNCGRILSVTTGGFCSWSGACDWDGRDLAGVVIPGGVAVGVSILGMGFADQSAFDAGQKIHHWERGILLNECTSLHLDYNEIDNCGIGVEISRGSGAPNMSPIRITNCGVGVLSRGNRDLLISDTLTGFVTTGTATPIIQTDAAVWPSTDQLNYDPRPLRQLRAILSLADQSGSVAEQSLWSVARFVAAWPPRERDTTELLLRGRCSPVLTTAMTLRVKLGNTALVTATLPIGAAVFTLEVNLSHINATDVRGFAKLQYASSGTGSVDAVTRLFEIGTTTGVLSISADTNFSVTKQAGAVGDHVQLVQGAVKSTIPGFLAYV